MFWVQSTSTLLDPTSTISQLIDEDLKRWKQPLLEQLFSLKEAKIIQEISVSCANQEDLLILRGT